MSKTTTITLTPTHTGHSYDLRDLPSRARGLSQSDRGGAVSAAGLAARAESETDGGEQSFALLLTVESYNTEGILPDDLWSPGVIAAVVKCLTCVQVARVLILRPGEAVLFFGDQSSGYGLDQQEAERLSADLTRNYSWLSVPVRLAAQPMLEQEARLQLKAERAKQRKAQENQSNSSNTKFYDTEEALQSERSQRSRRDRRRAPRSNQKRPGGGGGPSDSDRPSEGYRSDARSHCRGGSSCYAGSSSEYSSSRRGRPVKHDSRSRLNREEAIHLLEGSGQAAREPL